MASVLQFIVFFCGLAERVLVQFLASEKCAKRRCSCKYPINQYY